MDGDSPSQQPGQADMNSPRGTRTAHAGVRVGERQQRQGRWRQARRAALDPLAGAAAAAAAFGLPPPPPPAAAAAVPEEEDLVPGQQQQHQLPAAAAAAREAPAPEAASAPCGTVAAGPASVVEEAVAGGLRRLQDPLDGAAISAAASPYSHQRKHQKHGHPSSVGRHGARGAPPSPPAFLEQRSPQAQQGTAAEDVGTIAAGLMAHLDLRSPQAHHTSSAENADPNIGAQPEGPAEGPVRQSTQEERCAGRQARRAAMAARVAARDAAIAARLQRQQQAGARRRVQAQNSAAEHWRVAAQQRSAATRQAHVQAERRRRHPPAIAGAGRRWPPDLAVLRRLGDVQLGTPDDPLTARHYLGRMDRQCQHCGALHFIQERTAASTLTNPRFGGCCMHGQVSLPAMQDPPAPLLDLLTSQSARAKAFRSNIRAYNCAFQLASTALTNESDLQGGIRSVCMHGCMYHRVGPLHPAPGADRAFGQLWIYDSDYDSAAAVQARNQVFGGNLDDAVLTNLQTMLEQHNHLVQVMQAAAAVHNSADATIEIDEEGHVGHGHARQWNAPTGDQVAAILPGDGTTASKQRTLVLYLHGGALVHIHDCHPWYFPAHYVLLFPRGELGWRPGIPLNRRAAAQARADPPEVAEGEAAEAAAEEAADAAEEDAAEEAAAAEEERRPGGDGGDEEGRARTVTLTKWGAYYLYTRADSTNMLHRSERLFQEFACDVFAIAEQQRLRWIRFNQTKLRAALYRGIADAVHRGDTDASTVGRAIILPSSHLGSPRCMQQLYQDAMAIVRKMGKPDLFITITCNPEWPEIQEQLLPGQTALGRPDLLDRVFKLKLDFLLDLLLNKNILGSSIAHIYVIEFQKRGLPHAHLLIIFAHEDKLRTPEDIDSVVCAELPDPVECPLLHKIVSENMMHGPCGGACANAPCMEDGECTKRFPRSWQDETVVPDDAYPLYRRRNDGRTVLKKGVLLDNRWVVPYNKLLTLLLACHLNVEAVASVKAVKYLYKYVYKGPDMVRARVIVAGAAAAPGAADDNAPVDEVSAYLSARYFSAPAAAWRTLEFPMHGGAPHVERLDLHLPGEHCVVFHEGQLVIQLLDRLRDSKLMAWFKLNLRDPAARAHLYIDIPSHYTWHAETREWRPRRRGSPVGRLYLCGPEAGERYCLRLLLVHVPGATSWESLRTVQTAAGLVVCDTFREACCQRGLLSDEREADASLEEAAAFRMPHALRQMFAALMCFTEVGDPAGLWGRHEAALTEDILLQQRQLSGDPELQLGESMRHQALREVQAYLEQYGTRLADFGLQEPPPVADVGAELPGGRFLREHLRYNRHELADFVATTVPQLNEDQRHAFDTIMAAVHAPAGTQASAFFLDGPGGSGKTHLYIALLAAVRKDGGVALACASSGLAALNMPGGKTAHSTFKIPLQLHPESMCNIDKDSPTAHVLRAAKLLIWDEATMTHRHAFEALDRTLRDIVGPTGAHLPFGGKVLVAGGDFRQILPVVRRGSAPQIVAAALCRSELWQHFTLLRLRINMRVERLRGQDDAAAEQLASFANFLLEVGEGRLPTHPGTSYVQLPERVLAATADPHGLSTAVFGDLSQYQGDGMDLVDRGIMTPLNEDVDYINNLCMQAFPGEERVYHSVDSLKDPGEAALYPAEFLHTLTPSGLPPHELRLKPGAPIMLLRNINAVAGLANGTRLVVEQLTARVNVAKIANGSRAGTSVFIPRFTMAPSDQHLPFDMQRRQFPVRPAFAMSINKAQGQTMSRAGVYLPKPVFTHGQLYVAMSRVGAWHQLVVCVPPASPLHAGHLRAEGAQGTYTKNIVYTEVLF